MQYNYLYGRFKKKKKRNSLEVIEIYKSGTAYSQSHIQPSKNQIGWVQLHPVLSRINRLND